MAIPKNNNNPSSLDEMVTQYNKMMDDPKKYANTVYKSKMMTFTQANPRSTGNLTVKKNK